MALRRVIVMGSTASLALLTACAVAAQDVLPPPARGLEAGVETDVGSLYLFRGLVFSAGAVAQTKVWLSSGGVDVYGWTNVAVPAAPGARTLDEVDTGASYSRGRGGFSVVPAIDVYMYRRSDAELARGAVSHTAEVSLALSYTRAGTTVSSKHVVDARSYRGAYFAQVGLGHTRSLTTRLALDVSALAGWASSRFARSYFGLDGSGVALASAGVALTRSVGRGVYLRPHAEVSVIPGARLRAAVSRPVNAVVGLAVGIAWTPVIRRRVSSRRRRGRPGHGRDRPCSREA